MKFREYSNILSINEIVILLGLGINACIYGDKFFKFISWGIIHYIFCYELLSKYDLSHV